MPATFDSARASGRRNAPLRVLLVTNDWPPPGPVVRRSAESLEAAGLNVEVFAFRGRGFYNYVAAWLRLRPRLHPGRYDLVHTQDAGALLTLPHRVPLVETITKIQRGAGFLARRANAIIVPSAEVGRRLRTRAAIHVLPPSLDERARVALIVDLYRSVITS